MGLFLLEEQLRYFLVVVFPLQDGVDEDQKLRDHIDVGQVDTASTDSLGDLLGYFPSALEFEVFHKSGVLVHGEDDVGKGLQRMDQELTDIDLAVLIDVVLIVLAEGGSILQDFVDVGVLGRVATQCELQERRVQVQSASHFVVHRAPH